MRKSSSVLAFVIVAAWVAMSLAQVTTGTISGTVSDSTGAVLPGVKIEMLSERTGAVRIVTTDAGGHYTAPSLAVGDYRITGILEGFQTAVRTGIVLTIGREAIVDMKLQVGAVSQSVEVTGEAALVQTTEATVSYLVSDQTMRDLPLNGRDMSQLILLNPGVTETETTGGQAFSGYGRRLSISGARGEDNTFLLDGGLIADFRGHIPSGPSGSLLGVESVQEFQVLTNAFSAQYGRALGGVFNSVSKSGTNEYHGNAYEFFRNQVLDAPRWQDNNRLRLLGADGKFHSVKPPLRRNQFGGTAGGPIKKDKIFFFAAYEGTRERLASTVTQTVFDDNARQGIFPSGRITVSPLMRPYIDWFPLATPGGKNNGDGTQEFNWAYSQPSTEDYGQGRIDVPSLTDKDSLFFRYTGSTSSRDTRASYPGSIQASFLSTKLMTLSETHIFSPTFLNTVRVHFNRVIPNDDGRELPPPAGVFITPGQSDSPSIAPGSAGSGTPSTIGGGGFATKPSIFVSNRFTYQDDMNWTIGAHSLQIGGQVERLQLNSSKTNRAFGVWTWSSTQIFMAGTCGNLQANIASGALASNTAAPKQCTNGVTTAFDPTKAALATENSYRGAPPNVGTYRRGMRHWFFGFYLQDNWRVNNKLTLNIGVRWEPYTVPIEVNGLMANMTDMFFPSMARTVVDCTGLLGCGGKLDQYWKNKSMGDIGPRFGFAYDLFGNGKTSVRGGFGLLYQPNDPNLYYNQDDRMPPLAFDYAINGTGRFPFAFDEIAGQSTLGPGFLIEYWNNKSPHMLQYNFTVQQQIGSSDVLSIGTAGSRGMNLVGFADYNTPYAFYNGRSYEFPNPAVQPNTNYSDLNYFGPFGDSWYNSLQISYQRRFSRGLQAGLSYTWGKTTSTSDTAQTANPVNSGSSAGKYAWDRTANKGLSGYDIAHSLNINYSYDLPFGRGMKGVVGKLLSGWKTTGILSYRSGHPGQITTGNPTALSDIRVPGRVPIVNPNYTGKFINGTPSDCDQCKYFDFTAEHCQAAADAATKCPFIYNTATGMGARELGNLGRNTLIGPNSISWNPALFKGITLTERTNLEFRMEVFNALNRPNFSFPSASLSSNSGTFSNTAGDITSAAEARRIQFALKLSF